MEKKFAIYQNEIPGLVLYSELLPRLYDNLWKAEMGVRRQVNKVFKMWVEKLDNNSLSEYLHLQEKYDEIKDSVNIKFVFDQTEFLHAFKECENKNSESPVSLLCGYPRDEKDSDTESLTSAAESEPDSDTYPENAED